LKKSLGQNTTRILEAEGKISSDMENLELGIDLLVQQIPNVAELH